MEDKEKIDAGFSAMLEKEQAELDQAVKEYFRGHWPDLSTEEGRNTPMTFTPFAVMRLAKHFYGLGKRARNPELSEISEKYAEKLDISKGWFDGEEIDGLIYESFIAGAEWQYQKDRGEFAKLKAKEWMSGYDDAVSRFVKISYTGERWFSTTNGEFIAGALFEEPIPADDVELYYRRRTRND